VFLDPDFLKDAKISAIRVHLRCENFGDLRTFKADLGLLNIFMGFSGPLGLKWRGFFGGWGVK